MVQVVVGAQWGDEGKGKVVDYLAEKADYIVRYQGGNNAGHTVVIGPDTFKLHHIPSGICRGKICVLGNGVVINPVALLQELQHLQQSGIDTTDKLWISDRAHLIQESHIALDQQQEASRENKVGTTGRGIGPAYTDKIQRQGIRLGMTHERREGWSEAYWAAIQALQPMLTDTTALLHQALEQQAPMILEGAQGTFLDIDHGTYPFVTSSNCTSGGGCTGTGLPPTAITKVIGLLKAYTTRVGNGPFPTEDLGEQGDFLQQQGHEFGTTTGRKRRCGWLDLVMANYSRQVNGISSWAMTKLDVLSGLKEIKICVAYHYLGERLTSYPSRADVLAEVTPEYVTLPGWHEPLQTVTHYTDLPQNVRNYIETIETLTKTPVGLVSYGPERNQTLDRM